MDIKEFWKSQVDIWNQSEFCGRCWTFGGVTDRAGINRYKIREETKCCVHVFITDRVNDNNFIYPSETSVFQRRINCVNSFTLWVLVPSRIDLNDFNEIPDHPEEESLEETIISPLRECLGCDDILDMCEAAGYLFRVERWSIADVYRAFDNNYTGLRIGAVFNEQT